MWLIIVKEWLIINLAYKYHGLFNSCRACWYEWCKFTQLMYLVLRNFSSYRCLFFSERLLSLTLEERRKEYDSYLTLDKIETWREQTIGTDKGSRINLYTVTHTLALPHENFDSIKFRIFFVSSWRSNLLIVKFGSWNIAYILIKLNWLYRIPNLAIL